MAINTIEQGPLSRISEIDVAFSAKMADAQQEFRKLLAEAHQLKYRRDKLAAVIRALLAKYGRTKLDDTDAREWHDAVAALAEVTP